MRIGQQVNIKLENYPYAEFGLLKGQVSSLSPMAKDNQYIINVTFPDGLTTTYQRQLNLSEQM